MTAIATLQDLLVHQLRDLYSAERQLVQALPKMVKNATSPELQKAFTDHLKQTEGHVSRLEDVFEQLGASSRGLKCKAMEGLVEEGKELFEEDIDPEVLDAGIIAAAQRVEHYEIAAYGTVCEFARALGHTGIVELMEATLEEEKAADAKLTKLAEGGINSLAVRGAQDNEDEMESDDEGDEMEEESDDVDAPTASRSASGTSAKAKRTKVGSRRR